MPNWKSSSLRGFLSSSRPFLSYWLRETTSIAYHILFHSKLTDFSPLYTLRRIQLIRRLQTNQERVNKSTLTKSMTNFLRLFHNSSLVTFLSLMIRCKITNATDKNYLKNHDQNKHLISCLAIFFLFSQRYFKRPTWACQDNRISAFHAFPYTRWKFLMIFRRFCSPAERLLTLIVLMWRIGWAHNNARK